MEEVYPDELIEHFKWIKRTMAEERIELLNITLSPYGKKDYRMGLYNRYNRDILAVMVKEPKQERLDRGGLNNLKVLTGGKPNKGR